MTLLTYTQFRNLLYLNTKMARSPFLTTEFRQFYYKFRQLALVLCILCMFVSLNTDSAFCQTSAQKILQKPAATSISKLDSQPAEKKIPQNLAFLLKRAGIFQLFVSALEQTNWLEKLSKDGPYTVLAPRDAAFVHMESTPRAEIFASKAKLKSFVEQHILPGEISLEQMKSMESLQTVSGISLAIEQKTPIKIAQAQLVRSDIKADNGLIHVLGVAKMLE